MHSGSSVLKESLKDEIPVKLISKHKDTQQLEAKEQSHSCSFCPKTFCNNSHLIRRIKAHVLTDSFECDDCGEKFSRKDNLQTHVRNHHLKNFDDVNTIHFKQKLARSSNVNFVTRLILQGELKTMKWISMILI